MSRLFRDDNQIPIDRVFVPGPNQNVTTSGSTARTASNFAATTTVVRLVATAACYVAFGGSTVEATTAGILMPPNVETYFGLPSGATRVAAIQVAAGGVLGVTEMR